MFQTDVHMFDQMLHKFFQLPRQACTIYTNLAQDHYIDLATLLCLLSTQRNRTSNYGASALYRSAMICCKRQ
jgi:hypothetical protein